MMPILGILVPFFLPWEAPKEAVVDARRWGFLDPPAGKHGRIVVRNGHLAFADGTPVKFWGTNLSGKGNFPPKEVAPLIAERIAKFGFNLVRLHGLDTKWKGIFDRRYPDTQHFDPEQLDKFDFLVAELRKRGIYVNIGLHVVRRFTEADGVPQAKWLAYAKFCTIFDRRMIELQKKFARDLLMHRNPYTGLTYAEDPAVVFVELTNENSLFCGWIRGFLRGKQTSRPVGAWVDIPPYYGRELTELFNRWLRRRYRSLAELRTAWGRGTRPEGEQMLRNGNFERGKEGWKLSVKSPAEAEFEVTSCDGGRCARVVVKRVTGTRWHIKLSQFGLAVEGGERYRVKFRAKASSPRVVSVGVCHAGPWRGHGAAKFEVGEEWAEFQFSFVAKEDDDNVRLSFHLGEAPGTVWLDDVVLQKAPIYGLLPGEDPWRGTVKRLQPEEFGLFTSARFRDEARFYFDLERAYFEEMRRFLKEELGVKALVIGTNHNYGLPALWAQSFMDSMDCHAYWQHPRFPGRPWDKRNWFIENTPMLDSPEKSTIAALCRSAVLGKPFTVGEYNHPFPNEYGCEAPLLIAAYAALQDWDGVCFYTFGHKWSERELSGNVVTGYFDIANEVSKMAQMPVAAALLRWGLVRPAKRLVTVSYSPNWCFDSLRHKTWRIQFFTEGGELSPLLPLVHRFRVKKFDAERTTNVKEVAFEEPKGKIVSDTGELVWRFSGPKTGLLTIDTPRLQAAIGWLGGREVKTSSVKFELKTPFCAVSLLSLDGRPLEASRKILLTAVSKCANTGMEWNEERTSIGDRWGGPPLLVEPVVGKVALRREKGAPKLKVIVLDGRGVPAGEGSWWEEMGKVVVLLREKPATVWLLLTAE